METHDGRTVNFGDEVWDVTRPFDPVILDDVFYVSKDEPPTVIVENQGQTYSRYPYELFFSQRECLLAARTKEYEKLKMYEEFVEVTRDKIDKINETLDTKCLD